ncbi:MAG TPA: hypothetical protein VLB05_08000 [Dongiaceae bacterium]|nr:hypothetical protein [Dongiaceae bacterium]
MPSLFKRISKMYRFRVMAARQLEEARDNLARSRDADQELLTGSRRAIDSSRELLKDISRQESGEARKSRL